MSLTFRELNPLFAAEVTSPIELRAVDDADTFAELRAGMDRYAVLVFHDQPFTDDEQLDFAQRFDGLINGTSIAGMVGKRRLKQDGLVDISNVDENGDVMDTENRRRMYSLGNRLWHTDASFNEPRGRYSMLHARVVPPVPADTEYADMRAAYDALPDEMKAELAGLTAHHSVVHSRRIMGFEFSADEEERLPGAVHPLILDLPSGRKSLYIASHQSRIMEMSVPDGRLLLSDLRDHAIQGPWRYVHNWRVGDLVIWDNRATMHRGLPFEDTKYRRELRRVTTLDVPLATAVRAEAIAVEV